MSHPIQAVLFDLDGTLFDTAPDFVAVVNRLRHEDGLPALGESLIRAQVSNGARALVTLAYELEEGEPGFAELRQRLLDAYRSHLAVHTCTFPGIDRLLETLEARAIPWGIVTNKPSTYTDPLLDGLGYRSRCAAVVCPDHVSRTKPDPEPLLLACSQLEIDPRHCIYIGDHQRDIDAGRAAGMLTAACAYGYIDPASPPDSWQADYIAQEASDLLDWFNALNWSC